MNPKSSATTRLLTLLIAACGLVLCACAPAEGDTLSDEQKIAKEKAIRSGSNNAAGGAPTSNGSNYEGGSSGGSGAAAHPRGSN